MSEKAIQEGMQTVMLSMGAFTGGDVVINDTTILDGSSTGAPYVIIWNSDNFIARQDTVTPTELWEIPFTLYERWLDWKSALNGMRDTRQAIIDKFDEVGVARAAGAASGLLAQINVIRADGPIGEVYPRYATPAQDAEANPVYLAQRMIAEVEEWE